MSDSRKRKKSAEEPRTVGVWLMLGVLLAAVSVSGYLMSGTTQRLRYPDLKELLAQTRYDTFGNQQLAADPATDLAEDTSTAAPDTLASPPAGRPRIGVIRVPSPDLPERTVEFRAPQDIAVADRVITGTVEYRTLLSSESKPQRVPFRTERTILGDAEEAELIRLLKESNVVWDSHRPSTFMADHGATLLMIGVLMLFGYLMLKRIGGVGSPMAFSRSRGKLYGQEDLPVTFEEVAGINEAVEEVNEIVDFLKHPEKYQQLGGRIPRGVLLVGPPGTGKTLLAKAIAGEAGVPFFGLSGSDFVEMFVGVGAARVRDMFQQAIARSPSIIFIDELDALGKSRGNNPLGGHDEREQTLNALLVEMDGFDTDDSVIVIAATNRPETLDPALLRPGRFDRHVLVDRPDVAGREEILKVHVKNVKLDDALQLKEIAAITSGFVGADLANLVNEATLLAARKEKTSVGIVDFNEAVERVTAGLEKKNRVMRDDEKVRVAYHEAGHALVATALPNSDPVHKVSIIPRGIAALGYTMQRPDSDRYLMTQSELESRMKVLLAGTLTEEMVFADISTGAQNDLERCTEIARSMVMDYGMSRLGRVNYRKGASSPFLATGGGEGSPTVLSEEMAKRVDQEVVRILDEALAQTREILEQRREALEAVTQRLLEVESIDHDELKRLLDENCTGPWLVPGTQGLQPRARVRTSQSKESSHPAVDIAPTAENQI